MSSIGGVREWRQIVKKKNQNIEASGLILIRIRTLNNLHSYLIFYLTRESPIH